MPVGFNTKPKGVRKDVWNRFKDFCFKKGYITWADIVENIGLSRWGLQRMLRDEHVGWVETKKKFEEIGLDTDWLFKGRPKVKVSITPDQHVNLQSLEQYKIKRKELEEIIKFKRFLQKHDIRLDDAYEIIRIYISSLKKFRADDRDRAK